MPSSLSQLPPTFIRGPVRVLRAGATWAAVVWVVIVWKIGNFSLLDPDEVHYAELTREMLRANRWLVPLLDGAPHIDKPVLYHWLQAGSVALLGESEWALRFPSAVAAVALFAALYWTGTQLLGGRVGYRAALMFATFPMTFVLASTGLFDMVFTAFLFTAVALLLVVGLRERPALEYAAWPLLTLAVMIKGPVAIVLVVLFGLALYASRTTRVLVTRVRWLPGLAFVVVTASPWFIYMAWTFGHRFVRDYVLAGNVWYFTAPRAFTSRRSDWAFYVRTFGGALFPWSIVALGRAADVLRAWRRGTPPSIEERVLWIWTGLVFGFFTVAGFKLDTYLYPAAPMVAILAAAGWADGSRPVASADGRWTRVAVLTVAAMLVAGGLTASVLLFRIDLGLTLGAMTLPLSLGAGGMLLAWQMRRRSGLLPPTILVPIAMLLSAYASIITFGLPILDQARPTAAVGRWIQRHSPDASPVGIVGLDKWRASLRYYSDRRVVSLLDTADVHAFLEQQPDAYVLMLRPDYRALRRQGMKVHAVGSRSMVVGSSGRYIRKQLWSRIVVVRGDNPTLASAEALDGDVRDITTP